MNRHLAILLIASAVTLPALPAQTGDGSMRALWENPVFRARLLGSFGVNSSIEPVLSPDQQEIYDQIIPLVADKAADAVRLIQEVLADADLGQDKGSAMFDFTLGNIYFQNNRPREAAVSFQNALKKFPDFRRAHQNLGILLIQGGQHAQSIQHLTRAMQLGAADGPLFGLLGSAYVMSGDHVAAETAFRNAIMFTPEVKDWKLGLMRALMAQEKFGEARTLAATMVAAAPTDKDLWLLQASAHLGLKKFKEAAADYEMLDLLGQSTPESLSTLGDIYANEGALAPAASAYLRAFEKNPAGPVDGPIKAAEILVARDGPAQADKLLDRVTKDRGDSLEPRDALRIKRLRARILQNAGETGKALTLWKEIVEADPLDGDSLVKIGQHYANGEEKDRAIHYYEAAAGIPEFEADAKVRHAQLLVSMGKYAEAVPMLRRAQELKPRDSIAKFLDDLERYLKGRR